MSLFKTWTFRSNHPTFEAGEEINAYLTTIDADTGRAEARIGDSILEVSGAKPEQLDQLVMLRVQSFDDQNHRGQAQIID